MLSDSLTVTISQRCNVYDVNHTSVATRASTHAIKRLSDLSDFGCYEFPFVIMADGRQKIQSDRLTIVFCPTV